MDTGVNLIRALHAVEQAADTPLAEAVESAALRYGVNPDALADLHLTKRHACDLARAELAEAKARQPACDLPNPVTLDRA